MSGPYVAGVEVGCGVDEGVALAGNEVLATAVAVRVGDTVGASGALLAAAGVQPTNKIAMVPMERTTPIGTPRDCCDGGRFIA